MKQVGAALCHVHPQRRAPRAAHQNDFFLAQALGHIFGNGQAVADHQVDGQHAICGAGVAAKGLARTALVPLHQREILGPGTVDCLRMGRVGVARTAVQKQDHRVGRVTAMNGDPMFDAIGLHKAFFMHWNCSRPGGKRIGGYGSQAGRGGKKQAQQTE